MRIWLIKIDVLNPLNKVMIMYEIEIFGKASNDVCLIANTRYHTLLLCETLYQFTYTTFPIT